MKVTDGRSAGGKVGQPLRDEKQRKQLRDDGEGQQNWLSLSQLRKKERMSIRISFVYQL